MPLGGGVGKIFHLGKLPVNTQLSAYYNVVQPDYGELADPRAGAVDVSEVTPAAIATSRYAVIMKGFP